MMFLILLSCIPPALTVLVDLSEAEQCEGADAIGTGFTKYFAIPRGSDTDEMFVKYKVHNSGPLVWPTTEKICEIPFNEKNEAKVCYEDNTENPHQTGIVYFSNKVNVDVYEYRNIEYAVKQEEGRLTVIFSKSKTGSILFNIEGSVGMEFSIYSGTPDDDNELLYTYNENVRINAIYIQEEVFYIVSNGTKFKFWVSDGGVSPLEKIFGNNGLVMTPQYPAMPDKIYLNTPITVIPQAVDRAVNVKLTGQLAAETATTTTETPTTMTTTKEATVKSGSSSFLQLGASFPSVGSIKITAGPNKCTIPTISTTELTGDCDIILPANSTSFQVESTKSAYIIQFDIEDLPVTTSSPATTPKPTAKPTTTPGCTCPPTTCPSTNSTCPPVTTCPQSPASCITTTTEIPTTTDGAATAFALSSFTMLCAYYLL